MLLQLMTDLKMIGATFYSRRCVHTSQFSCLEAMEVMIRQTLSQVCRRILHKIHVLLYVQMASFYPNPIKRILFHR